MNIVYTTCYANEFRVNNCSSGEVGERRQCQNGSCVGLNERKYLPDEYEIVYRNCTLIDFCPYPPSKHFKRLCGKVNLKETSYNRIIQVHVVGKFAYDQDLIFAKNNLLKTIFTWLGYSHYISHSSYKIFPPEAIHSPTHSFTVLIIQRMYIPHR